MLLELFAHNRVIDLYSVKISTNIGIYGIYRGEPPGKKRDSELNVLVIIFLQYIY